MFKNIFKITLRNLIKERFYATVNIFGLALGIASSLLIISYVLHETSYDKTHPDLDRLYRVNMTNIWMPGGGEWSSTSPPLAEVLVADYPEIEETVRINTPGGNIIRSESDGELMSFYESEILGADSNFFNLFDFELLYGDPKTALTGINKVVVSKEMAIKYFGTEQVLGETLLFGDSKTAVIISGVTDTQPTNNHFRFDFLISITTNPAFKNIEGTWIATQVVTYAKLKPGSKAGQLEQKMDVIAPNYAAAQLSGWGMEYEKFLEGKGEWKFYLQPVSEIHLNSAGIGNRIGPVSDGTYMYVFSFTAALILLLAVINFINLSTARASIRAKEVGVRKALGSNRSQLIGQFMFESVGLCFLAGIVGLGLAEFMRLLIENYMGSVFHIVQWYSPLFYVLFILFVVLVGFIAGIYPALHLTGFKPSKVLKGEFRTGQKSKWLRNGLVILQYSISIALMVGTLVVYFQLSYFNNKDVGYEKDNIVVINWAHKLGTHLEKYRQDVLSHPAVKNATISMDVIGRGSYEDIFVDRKSGHEQSIAMMKADEHQLETMGIELLMGRFFDKNNAADKHAIVINESTMAAFGYTEDNVLNQEIDYAGDDMGAARVIGVVRDFNFYSLHYPIAPYIFFHLDAPIWGSSRVVSIKTTSDNTAELLSFLENKWNETVSDAPFDYSFLNDEYALQYQTEQQLGVLFALFTVIALVIACLGLFGLASYLVSQKSKEIGIRKTLGASVAQILLKFNSSFVKLVVIAMCLALPIAWWAMESWLDQFVYRIDLEWYIFAIASLLSLVIALLTVSFHSVKAAYLNPVETLKDE
ncbi:MAG: ABC transporter permease [Fulvivirga sp.]